MKKCILSALLGAALMFLSLVLIANIRSTKPREEYKHIDYISAITPESCFICSKQGSYWGEDNVGIVDLNTFELLYLPINRYGDHKELLTEPAGVMQKSSLIDQETERYVHATVFPGNAFATVELFGVQYDIDRDSIQSHLCQNCLDSINSMWFTTHPPAEYAIVSFEERTVQPLLNAHPWFSSGKYGIDCEFKQNGKVYLLIHYAVNPYLTEQ